MLSSSVTSRIIRNKLNGIILNLFIFYCRIFFDFFTLLGCLYFLFCCIFFHRCFISMNFYFFFKKCCCYYYYYLHAIQLFTTNMYQYSLPYSCLFIVLDTGESGVEEWAQWSSCSVTCGQGSQVRTRTCVSPYGTHCSGPLRESRVCNNTALCPGSVSSQYMKLWMLLNLFNAKHLKHHSLTM